MTLTAALHSHSSETLTPTSLPSCAHGVRKPCHLLRRLLPWSDRCPDVICLHLWPPSVLLVHIVKDGVRRESSCSFIYVKCIGSSVFWELKPAPLAILDNNLSALLFHLSFPRFPCLLHHFCRPRCSGFSASEPSPNLHFCSALLPAWQRKIRGSGPGVCIPPSLLSSHPPPSSPILGDSNPFSFFLR